jgi:hypothetical protein
MFRSRFLNSILNTSQENTLKIVKTSLEHNIEVYDNKWGKLCILVMLHGQLERMDLFVIRFERYPKFRCVFSQHNRENEHRHLKTTIKQGVMIDLCRKILQSSNVN